MTPQATAEAPSKSAPIDWLAADARRAERMGASEIRELLKILDKPGMISFGGGIPDPALFPAERIRMAFAEALAEGGTAARALQYSVSEGHLPLRQWIAGHMAGLGVPCGTDNVVITNGSQQALDLLGKQFLTPGDTALVTTPTYLGALQAFNPYEPRYDTLTPDGGNRASASYADEARRAGGRVALAYVVPDFANPTGETLTLGQRDGLLDLAASLSIPVIEDGAYTALRYDGDAIPPLIARDLARVGDIDASRVMYCGTFSKVFAPALRIGWICAARPLIERIVLSKQACDLHSATLNQMVMARLAETHFTEQVARIRPHYRRHRDRMLAALATHMPAGATWTEPEGGMFIWVTLPPGPDGPLDAGALLARAINTARVAFVPGQAFFHDGRGTGTLRLSFSLANDADIDRGIGRLGALIAEAMG